MEDYLEACARLGEEPQRAFSGQLSVRIDPGVNARMVEVAMQHSDFARGGNKHG